MKVTKINIINASIDLFAEHGVGNTSVEKIAKKLGVTRGIIYYYFKDGKEEIIAEILKIFDEMIQANTPNQSEWIDINTDAKSILSKLFFAFKREESETCRKINHIIFCNYHYVKQIKHYMINKIFDEREMCLEQCFNILIKDGKLESFDTKIAARLLNRSLIATAMKDSFNPKFKKNELPPALADLQHDCMFIVHQILNGNFVV